MDDHAFNDLGYDDDGGNANLTSYGNLQCSPPRDDNVGDLTSASIPTRANTASSYSAKRGCELGDWSNPMDWHMRLEVDGNIAKRRKTEELENAIARTTLRIMDMKKRRQSQMNSVVDAEQCSDDAVINQRQEKLLKYPPVTGARWFGVSSDDSLYRGYLQTRSSVRESFISEWKSQESRHMATRNFCALLEQVRLEIDGRVNPTDTQALLGTAVTLVERDNSLWIEKYNPKCFLDLITEEEHNRCVLLWLRLWQEYVMHKKLNLSIFTDRESRILETEERHGRVLPKFKILVLQGPSGIGKSVLACVAARQAEYEPFVVGITEMQGMAEFKSRIENIAELGAISKLYQCGAPRRPACLILDGIDYASADIIHFLTSWASRDPRKVALRPIICTCNNVYTQSLKELRTNSLVIKMNGCDKVRLRKRLQQVILAERIKIDDIRLKVLIEVCRADIRLCLNTLQFFYFNASGCSTRGSFFDSENLDMVKGNDSASDASIFEALESIITLDYHLNRKGAVLNPSERCRRIYNLMNRRDDLDRFYQCLFHNFSEAIKLTNSQARRASQYFVYSDLNYQVVYASQNFTLMKYQVCFAVALHLSIAIHVSKRFIFNLSFTAINERRREAHEIVRIVRTNTLKSSLSFRFSELVQSILPSLYYIVQPPIKGVDVQLFSGSDLCRINRVVAIMCTFRMTYTLKYNNDGIYYCLEPAIEQVIVFNENTIGGFSTNLRKYIAHQITIASIKGESLSIMSLSSTPVLGDRTRPDPYELADWTKENRKQQQNHDGNIPSTPLAVKRRKDQSDGFTFRYNQGSSQAVRRNIRIDTLFFK